MSDDAVDVGAVVAEIEADVARRRAAGEYPEALLRRIHAEFSPADDEPPELLAVVGTPVRPESKRPLLGPVVVFVKRALRRAIAWYVQPIATEQTRFNIAILRELRQLQRRLDRLRTPWEAADGMAARAPSKTAAIGRVAAIVDALEGATSPVLITGVPADVLDGIESKLRPLEVRRSRDPFDAFDRIPPQSLGAAALIGVLPRLARGELLTVIPAALRALRPGGVLVLDAPERLPRADEGRLDVSLQQAIPRTVGLFLCTTAGLASVTARDSAPTGWYALRGLKPAE